jgi:shikimate dehydrogenase
VVCCLGDIVSIHPSSSPQFQASSQFSVGSHPGPSDVLVGLIGAGIQHSLSPVMHETEAAHHGLRLQYLLIDVDQELLTAQTLPELLKTAKEKGFRGLNITFPFKQAVLPLLDSLSAQARAMGAVNTVLFENGRTTGHNTDAPGWSRAFQAALPDADLRCVTLLGAGGAGAAVAHAVLALGAQHLFIHDREHARAETLAATLCKRFGQTRASAEVDVARPTSLSTGLIQATPTGMDKLPGMPLPASLLRSDMWVAEVVYFPLETAFLKAARAAGCATVDGGGMAVWQAVGAFELFTGRAPNAARMEAHFRACVARRQAT